MSSWGRAGGSSAPARLSPTHGLQPGGEKKEGRGTLLGRTKGGMNTKFHSVADSESRLMRMFVTARPVSDYIGSAAMLEQPAEGRVDVGRPGL